jgi:hypothetical protein
MRNIPLTKGYIAIVDDSDYPFVSQFKWRAMEVKSGKVYATRHQFDPKINNNGCVYLHREIMGLGKGNKMTVDHINNNSLDCRRENMRIATQAQNCCNRRKRPNCISKFKGVSLCRGRYQMKVTSGNNTIVKNFDNEVDAAIMYNEIASILHGEYALLNEVPHA